MEDQWRKVEELFHAAMDIAQRDRAAFLDAVCNGDGELRSQVCALLEHAESADPFEPAIAAISRSAAGLTVERFGPWRVERELGRGGMGTVYLASRDDGAYSAKAAIKFVHPGLDTDAILGRFRQERQILANLQHPHIARLLDGGLNEQGRPYIVMEYVEGQPITEYCQSHGIAVEEILRLLQKVCLAIHYAHQHMVIHRDVKPGNILVSREGVPKLLDFGIAKLMDQESDETGPRATTMARALTPDYASPEQVRGEAVSTLTDIYSLGAVLYELLSGKRPYQFQALGQAELERAICQTDVAKPSSWGKRELSGDLDTIVLKAMQKEPERRYQSAVQLSDDLQRYLDGAPVIARPDDAWYRVGKFVRRHRTAVGAGALVVLSLIGGIAATTWQKRVADEHARRADRRFAQVRKLANTFLFEFHEKIKALPGATEARELVVKTALEYLDSLSAESVGDQQLQSELATAYESIAEIQSARGSAGLGRSKDAAASRDKALAIREALAVGGDVGALRALAVAYTRTADLADRMGEGEKRTKLLQRALPLADGILARSATAEDHAVAGEIHSHLARVYQNSKLDESLRLYESSLEHYKKAGDLDPSPDRLNARATAHVRYGNALGIKGKTKESEEHFRQAVSIREELVKQHPLNRNYRHGLMNLHAFIGQSTANEMRENYNPDVSLAHYKRALEIAEEIERQDPKDATARYDLAVMSALTGGMLSSKPMDGVRLYRRAISILGNLSAADPGNRDYPTLRSMHLMYMSELYMSARQPDNALAALKEGADGIAGQLKLRPDSKTLERDLMICYRKMGQVYLAKSAYSAARGSFEQALRLVPPTPLEKLGITPLQHRGYIHIGLSNAAFGMKDRKAGCGAAKMSAAIWDELARRGKPSKAVVEMQATSAGLVAACGG